MNVFVVVIKMVLCQNNMQGSHCFDIYSTRQNSRTGYVRGSFKGVSLEVRRLVT